MALNGDPLLPQEEIVMKRQAYQSLAAIMVAAAVVGSWSCQLVPGQVFTIDSASPCPSSGPCLTGCSATPPPSSNCLDAEPRKTD